MAIDWNKPVQTKDGRKVRVLCTDSKGYFPIVGLVVSEDGESEDVVYWPLTGELAGRPDHDYQLDLINVPEKHEIWVNVYADNMRRVHGSRQQADGEASRQFAQRIACIRVEFEEGEGLE